MSINPSSSAIDSTARAGTFQSTTTTIEDRVSAAASATIPASSEDTSSSFTPRKRSKLSHEESVLQREPSISSAHAIKKTFAQAISTPTLQRRSRNSIRERWIKKPAQNTRPTWTLQANATLHSYILK